MKKLLLASAAIVCCGMAMAQVSPASIKIDQVTMGSGTPTNAKVRNEQIAHEVGDYGVYHVPQYMPYFPTAATIWPRVVEVRCHGDKCDGYEYKAEYGRAEYLFFKPRQVVAKAEIPVVVVPTPLPPAAGDRNLNKKFNQ
jgi:hypothetical protein